MATQSESFFSQYAEAFDQQDVQAITAFFMTPTVIMSDSRKTLYREQVDVQEAIQRLLDRLEAAGVCQHQVEVSQSIKLSETILFTRVRWWLRNANEQQVSCFDASYTLQLDADQQLKIIVCVLEDAEGNFTQLLDENA